MTKEKMYKKLLHTAKSPETLDEIILDAMYDDDIKTKDFGKLLDEMNNIKMKKGW